MMPKQVEIEDPLLKCLEELGGQGRPPEIYSGIRKFFPNLTEADIDETLSSGGNKWTNRIQWTRQRLITKREMTSPSHGVWAITDKGRQRLGVEGLKSASTDASQESESTSVQTSIAPAELGGLTSTNLEELADEYLSEFKQKILQKLQDLTPGQFERFAGTLLSAYGFN